LPARAETFVAGLVLAAGGSARLGRPKQLLPYRGDTLLGHTLEVARSCRLQQLIVAIGGHAEAVRAAVDLGGTDVVENPSYGGGCSSSIAAGLRVLDSRCEVLVLLLGDQPGVSAQTVRALIAARGDAPLAVCRYDDGRGHPLAFARDALADLGSLHGDKGVWKLLDRRARDVFEVPVAGLVPRDVDTAEDYRELLAGTADLA
jgi:molybdenum cofactor cytidylyltransferase